MKKIIKTKNAPEAIGPYSQAVKVNGFLFSAGQIGIDPSTGQLVDELGLGHLLEHRWINTVSYFGEGSKEESSTENKATNHYQDYGLFDKKKLQNFLDIVMLRMNTLTKINYGKR